MTFDELQAEPDETLTPPASNKSCISRLEKPGTEKLSVVGTLTSKGVLNTIVGKVSTSVFLMRSRYSTSVECEKNNPLAGLSSASKIAPIADTPGRFSVPERIPFSCPPPTMRGTITVPVRTYKNPIPLGA